MFVSYESIGSGVHNMRISRLNQNLKHNDAGSSLRQFLHQK